MFVWCLLLAVILDVLFGDPEWYPHPVRLIGKLISFYEDITRKILPPLLAGVLTFTLVTTTVATTLFLIFSLIPETAYYLKEIVATLIMYTCVAIKDLRKEAFAVYTCLEEKGLESARLQVARIVGRDTDQLDKQGVTKATVETIAENLSDGVVAPLFWGTVFGIFAYFIGYNQFTWCATGALLYKTINTMDSMIGYKNTKYILFGRFAAKTDDVANYLPARLTAYLLLTIAVIARKRPAHALQMYRRDCSAHSSPNAGHPESVVAGMLGVELCGDSFYFGEKVSKPKIGERLRDIKSSDIIDTNRFCLGVVVLFFLFLFIGSLFFVLLN